jgi:TusA-related sulfurtransferase
MGRRMSEISAVQCQPGMRHLPSSSSTRESRSELKNAWWAQNHRDPDTARVLLESEGFPEWWAPRSRGRSWRKKRRKRKLPTGTRKGVRTTTDQVEQPVEELDLRGNVCPGPTGDTLAALKDLPAGDKLAVISDYLPARQTIPRLVEQRGCSWQITEDDGKTFRMEIVKGGG